jgi:hypothetical protein
MADKGQNAVIRGTAVQPVPIAPRKDDKGKPNMTLLPWDALWQVAKVLTWACVDKVPPYGPNSWRNVPGGLERYRAALVRHIASYEMGERVDGETSLPTVAHIATDALIFCALALAEERRTP